MIYYTSPLCNAWGALTIYKTKKRYYLVLDDYVGSDRVIVSKKFVDSFIQEMEK